jgi:hypothetical protein
MAAMMMAAAVVISFVHKGAPTPRRADINAQAIVRHTDPAQANFRPPGPSKTIQPGSISRTKQAKNRRPKLRSIRVKFKGTPPTRKEFSELAQLRLSPAAAGNRFAINPSIGVD